MGGLKTAMLNKPHKVIIVDDDPGIFEILQETLEMLFPDEIDIRVTESPMEAIEWVAQGDVRIIISDLRMPEMGGSEFLSKIKAMQTGVMFILITGSHSFLDASTAFMDGAWGYIMKPFTHEDLERSVGRCIESLNDWNRVISKFGKEQEKSLKKVV